MSTKVQFAVDKQMIFFDILLKLYKCKLYYVSLIKPKFLNLVDKFSKKRLFLFFQETLFFNTTLCILYYLSIRSIM